MSLIRTLSIPSTLLAVALLTACSGPEVADTTVRDNSQLVDADYATDDYGSTGARVLDPGDYQSPGGYPGDGGSTIMDVEPVPNEPWGGNGGSSPNTGLGSSGSTSGGIGDLGEPLPGLEDGLEGVVSDRPIEIVYFAYDSSEIGDSERRKLDYVAEHLIANPSKNLLIEGHCDERGSEEYNRALGERRALAARDYLATKGIPVSRIRTISYGEEQPEVVGNSESVYSKNRRAEMVLVTPVADPR